LPLTANRIPDLALSSRSKLPAICRDMCLSIVATKLIQPTISTDGFVRKMLNLWEYETSGGGDAKGEGIGGRGRGRGASYCHFGCDEMSRASNESDRETRALLFPARGEDSFLPHGLTGFESDLLPPVMVFHPQTTLNTYLPDEPIAFGLICLAWLT